jgi:hypothetical protein
VACPAPQVVDVPVGWVNAQLDAAKRLFLEKHPLAKVRDQAALIRGADSNNKTPVALSEPLPLEWGWRQQPLTVSRMGGGPFHVACP